MARWIKVFMLFTREMRLLFKMAFLAFFAGAGFAAQEKELMRGVYPFKERIHDLCSGHGLIHLDHQEIQDICDLFLENAVDVEALQELAPSDDYLSQLTALIIRSDLPTKTKNNLLRRSYEVSLERTNGQSEWWKTISLLIEETRVMKEDEVVRHTSSGSRYLQAHAERCLKKLSSDTRRSLRSPEDDGLNEAKDIESSENLESRELSRNGWFLLAGSSVVLAIFGLVFRGCKRRNP